MRVTTEGAPPRAPFFLVTNHLSYTDVVLLASQLDCIFVAKREVQAWPFLGALTASVDSIFLDRENLRDILRVNDEIEHALERGDGIVVFAEGTSSRGETVLPLRPSLLELPARKDLPVRYASISYRTPEGAPAADRAVCWWGDMTFPGHFFRLLKLPYFEAQVVFGEKAIQEADRKQLARRLHQAISERFVPVTEVVAARVEGGPAPNVSHGHRPRLQAEIP